MGKRAAAIGAAVAVLACAGAALAATVQQGDLRITALARIEPEGLPRDRPAPIAIFVAGHLENSKGGIPPQLQSLRIQVNRHGLLQSKGLPVCEIPEVQPASTQRALQNCKGALI